MTTERATTPSTKEFERAAQNATSAQDFAAAMRCWNSAADSADGNEQVAYYLRQSEACARFATSFGRDITTTHATEGDMDRYNF